MKKRKGKHYLVLDVGTTGIKAFVFDPDFRAVALKYVRIHKSRHGRHRVEQDPKELLAKSILALRGAVRKSRLGKGDICGLGLTNQRETIILWDRSTGRPAYPAIVWQDNRTQAYCEKLRARPGFERSVMDRTGLPILPYFSAPKIRWALDNVPSAAVLAESGKLAIGTVDSWLIWNMSGVHATDYTNASRTLLFNIKKMKWDDALLGMFGVPARALPKAMPSRSDFGRLDPSILGFGIPILAVCGDQQASLFAAGSAPGTAKVTYGTGAFFMQILGRRYGRRKGFFTTIAASGRRPVFAIEAKVNKGAAEVLRVLKKPVALRRTITAIAREVGKITDRLSPRPRRITIDGGITKYKDLPEIQERISKMPVRRQSMPDGTALGIAKLMARR